MTMKPLTQGVDHVGLTVTDLEEAVCFFRDALGFELVGGKPEYPAAFVSDGQVKITLWQVREPGGVTEFNRFANIGLHHLAFRIGTLEQLHALHERLAERSDVEIEFAPQLAGAGPGIHMMCYGPSGIRLEFRMTPAL